MTDRLINAAITAFEDRGKTPPSRDDLEIAMNAFEASLARCGCDDCATARQERAGMTAHDRTALARVIHENVYSPGAVFDRAVPGIQEYMLACADKVAASLPWLVPTPEVTLEVEKAHTPTNDERELLTEADALIAAWDLKGSWSPDSPVGLVMRLADTLRRFSVVPESTGPWDNPLSCFGHCDKEGWYAECVSKKADAEAEPQGEPSDAPTREDIEYEALCDQVSEANDILARIVSVANKGPLEGEDGFILGYQMAPGPIHAAIPFLQKQGIVFTTSGEIRTAVTEQGEREGR